MTGAASAAAAVTAARSWLGTPYMHAQRVRGVGVDCVGLVIAAFNEVGLFGPGGWDVRQYSPQVNVAELRRYIDRWLVELPEGAPLADADVLLFDIAGAAQHVGLYAAPRPGFPGGSLLHAYQTAGRVCEHDYERFWRRRTCGRFRWRAWAEGGTSEHPRGDPDGPAVRGAGGAPAVAEVTDG